MIKKEMSDLTNLYKRLDVDSSEKEWDFKTKEDLKILMKTASYRRKKDYKTGEKYNAFPTDKQLQIAWDYLKHGKKTTIEKENKHVRKNKS